MFRSTIWRSRTLSSDQSCVSIDRTIRSRHGSANHNPPVTHRRVPSKGAETVRYCPSNTIIHTNSKIRPVITVMAATGNTTSASNTQTGAPWHAAYPAPRNAHPASITRAELLQDFRDGKKAGKDFILIDLRRNDHEVRSGSSAQNVLGAESFTGRNCQRVSEPPSTEPVPIHSNALRCSFCSEDQAGDLVLWSAGRFFVV